MAKSPGFNGFPIAPLTGTLDARSSPDAMAPGTFRMRKNLQTVGNGKLRRGCGWTKFRSVENYNNTDYHDQLLHFTTGVPRQPITFLLEAENATGARSLIVGKQGALFKTDEYSGTQILLGTGFGGTQTTSASAPRFKGAVSGDYLLLTNDFDKVQYHILEASPIDAAPLLQTIPDLDVIGLRRARLIWEWKGVVFLADVEMDGERFGYRLVWSDFQNPLSWDPANVASITGSFDLYTHERILGGRPLGNSFYIYTTHGIWQMDAVGGSQSFAFGRRYNGEDNPGQAVLKYPNTLIATDETHAYMAEDGIYVWTPYAIQPQRLEWLHHASSVLYDSIDTSQCNVHVAGYHGNEAYFSVKRVGAANDCPDITLRVHSKYQVADVVDYGFTAFCNYRSYNVPTIRDWIVQNGICDLAGLTAAGYPYGNESLPRPLPSSGAAFTPHSIYTSTPLVIPAAGDVAEITVEDYTKLTSDSNSLCALLGDEILDETCRRCAGDTLLVAAAAVDWCLKEIGGVFYRERCVNPTGTGATDGTGYHASIGSFVLDPYDSILVPAPIYQSEDPNVKSDEVLLDYLAVAQTPASKVSLRVGLSSQPADPNSDLPLIVWHQHSTQDLVVQSELTMAQHLAQNTVPFHKLHWHLFREARVIYFEVKVAGTGGDALFTRLRASVMIGRVINS